jgi:hypothetical protein
MLPFAHEAAGVEGTRRSLRLHWAHRFVHKSGALRAAGLWGAVRHFGWLPEMGLSPDKSIKIATGADG